MTDQQAAKGWPSFSGDDFRRLAWLEAVETAADEASR